MSKPLGDALAAMASATTAAMWRCDSKPPPAGLEERWNAALARLAAARAEQADADAEVQTVALEVVDWVGTLGRRRPA